MGNESGTWIMYGVDWDDPECIHTVDEAIEYIKKIVFLPLFKHEIYPIATDKQIRKVLK